MYCLHTEVTEHDNLLVDAKEQCYFGSNTEAREEGNWFGEVLFMPCFITGRI